MLDLGPYLRRPASTLASIASDPLEAWVRFSEQFAASREASVPQNLYVPDPGWESRLLRGLDRSAAERLNTEFWSLWSKVIDELAAKGIQAGPASFKGWNDGDAGLVRAIWILARRIKPRIVVETGVAHGVTSRFILEALERNGIGQLFSIDRAPIEPEWQNQIGVAVDRRLQGRWTFVRGSSRRRLPPLISRLGTIDLFVHDSLHSERNVRFEMDQAFAVLRSGGAVVVDDIDVNRGFWSFTRSISGFDAIVCESEPQRPDLRRDNDRGLFGIIIKTSPDGQ
jgi:Methyltransferase domain